MLKARILGERRRNSEKQGPRMAATKKKVCIVSLSLLANIGVKVCSCIIPHIKSKFHNGCILAHNPLAVHSIYFRKNKSNCKQGHLVVEFQHTLVKFVQSWIFCQEPSICTLVNLY